jgi:hypothetical protein
MKEQSADLVLVFLLITESKSDKDPFPISFSSVGSAAVWLVSINLVFLFQPGIIVHKRIAKLVGAYACFPLRAFRPYFHAGMFPDIASTH